MDKMESPSQNNLSFEFIDPDVYDSNPIYACASNRAQASSGQDPHDIQWNIGRLDLLPLTTDNVTTCEALKPGPVAQERKTEASFGGDFLECSGSVRDKQRQNELFSREKGISFDDECREILSEEWVRRRESLLIRRSLLEDELQLKDLDTKQMNRITHAGHEIGPMWFSSEPSELQVEEEAVANVIPVTQWLDEERPPDDFEPETEGQGALQVITRQANCNLSLWIKVVLLPTMLVFVVSAVIYIIVTQWIRVQNGDFLRPTAPRVQTDHTDLPLFPGCDNTACRKYRAGIESSLNWSKNPCENFYKFVCDGWRHHHHMVSILDIAEDEMYSHALNSVKWAPQFSRRNGIPTRSTPSAQKKVAALVRSCMRHSKNGFDELKTFMAEHHLPWPMTSPKDLLDILFDLSGNWNIHLWFHVTLDLAPYQAGTGNPLLKIGSSAMFGAWIALMRTFAGQRRGTEPSLRYQKYVKIMLALFGVSELLASEMASTIQEMDMLTLEMLGPAIVDPEQKILRLSIQNVSDAVTPGFPTDRWALLVDTHFPWAHRYSANIELHAETPSLLRAVGYLLGLKSETREALALSLGLRVVTELGWMADREIAEATLQLFGLPWSSHTRRCLVEVESRTGVAWLSLFPRDLGADTLIRDVRDVLLGVVMRRSGAMLHMTARKEISHTDVENYLASVLPEPTPGTSFFNSWMKLIKVQWRLKQHDLSNIVKPRSVLSHRWSVHGALTASEEYFEFPLYHPDLPPAVNYGGAGRLLADEVLRELFYTPLKNQQQGARYYFLTEVNETNDVVQEWSPYHVDTKALLAALKAYRLGLNRPSPDTNSVKPSHKEDRLFFVASCYALCSSANRMGDFYGDAEQRCNVAAKALVEFKRAFQCYGYKDALCAAPASHAGVKLAQVKTALDDGDDGYVLNNGSSLLVCDAFAW
ncbi:hypothetical protein V5799_012513 [Amblyomma americanum]|uniref:Peptidase M13 N-terminal domain-containing protein n=1 Tax=Amblyomma americanum TaxID=6943 RepID=A0AAQ4EE78_AMBAM